MKRVLALALLVVLLTPTTATAHKDVFSDPDDVPTIVDVRSTARIVKRFDGKRTVAIAIRLAEPWTELGPGYSIRVRLDTRGGPRGDARIKIRQYDAWPPSCDLLIDGERQGGSITISVFPGGDRTAVCPFPARRLPTPTKPIRWRIVALPKSHHNPDFAPDIGWYV